LAIVREIEGQYLLLDVCREHVDLLSDGIAATGPQEGLRYQEDC
jgi:hypothetical protein